MTDTPMTLEEVICRELGAHLPLYYPSDCGCGGWDKDSHSTFNEHLAAEVAAALGYRIAPQQAAPVVGTPCPYCDSVCCAYSDDESAHVYYDSGDDYSDCGNCFKRPAQHVLDDPVRDPLGKRWCPNAHRPARTVEAHAAPITEAEPDDAMSTRMDPDADEA